MEKCDSIQSNQYRTVLSNQWDLGRLHGEDQNTHFTGIVRTFGSEMRAFWLVLACEKGLLKGSGSIIGMKIKMCARVNLIVQVLRWIVWILWRCDG